MAVNSLKNGTFIAFFCTCLGGTYRYTISGKMTNKKIQGHWKLNTVLLLISHHTVMLLQPLATRFVKHSTLLIINIDLLVIEHGK